MGSRESGKTLLPTTPGIPDGVGNNSQKGICPEAHRFRAPGFTLKGLLLIADRRLLRAASAASRESRKNPTPYSLLLLTPRERSDLERP